MSTQSFLYKTDRPLRFRDFSVQVPGKWILAGEHAVLRGAEALVFPLFSKCLRLTVSGVASLSELHLELLGERGSEFELLFWGVLEKACGQVGLRRQDLRGRVQIESSIPVGSGLGASAALCVALSHWFFDLQAIQQEEQYEFARGLEDLFHGESSGVDIAVALSQSGLCFQRSGERTSFQPAWFPQCYISFSGKRGVTLDCVKQVKGLLSKDPEHFQSVDARMKQAVFQAKLALQEAGVDQARSQEKLAEALELAGSCFEAWGLISELPRRHIEMLREHGAQAVKLTGSGDGGYVLSLWSQPPPATLQEILIPCFSR